MRVGHLRIYGNGQARRKPSPIASALVASTAIGWHRLNFHPVRANIPPRLNHVLRFWEETFMSRFDKDTQFRLKGAPQFWLILSPPCRTGYVRGWHWDPSGSGISIEAVFREEAIETLDEINGFQADA